MAKKDTLRQDHVKAPKAEELSQPGSANFAIVGLGASAGGLEAFEEFFHHMQPDSGMAFVLVSHLDPDHVSILTEILQRTTRMPVVEAQDQLVVMPNSVYVIPPNRDMAIFHRALQLTVPEQPRGRRMPIDAFMSSLADDQGESAIGIVLSGTGTDGTLGLRAILGAGGITLVQDPATAKYDGMPTSAVHAGFATHVVPVAQMPEILQADIKHLSVQRLVSPTAVAANSMNRILMQLRAVSGNDFSLYKMSTISRRIERRMSQHDIHDPKLYARYIKEHPEEVKLLIKELLINVTSFFRDAEAFATLQQVILPGLLADKPEDYVMRIWVAGCATGEEAYSIAILLREYMDHTQQEFKIQLYATDLDDEAISIARAGIYPPNIAQDIDPERLRKFFIKEQAGYRVKKIIREMVVFAIQNVIKDPPFIRLDLLSCRNMMIYMEAELQNRLIPAFHYALKPGGTLFLSPSESIGKHPELFTALNRKWKFYQAIGNSAASRSVKFGRYGEPKEFSIEDVEQVAQKRKYTNFSEMTKRALLDSYAPASVVIDENGTLLFVHGDTGRYLRLAPGEATLNIIEMAHEGLKSELSAAILAANSHASALPMSKELLISANEGTFYMCFSVRILHTAESTEKLLMVSFHDVASVAPVKPKRKKPGAASVSQLRIEELEHDLARAKEIVQVTIEEHQASNEEMNSTNEELQSTNEELQSTNEELETSKEELQSLNEELITVNAELQSKIEQLAVMQNDMKNLLDNTHFGTIFLDARLRIKRFTREAAQAYRLVASDVGRSLNDIKSNIKAEDLLAEAQLVLDTLVPMEREVQTLDGCWYLVRIQPYRTVDDMIIGVVITFTDISQRVVAELAEKSARIMAEGIVDTVREPLIVLDGKLKVISASRSFYRAFKTTPEDTVGRQIYDLGNRQWDIPKLRELLEQILPLNQSFDDYVVEHDFPVYGHRRMLLNARRIIDELHDIQMILMAIEIDA